MSAMSMARLLLLVWLLGVSTGELRATSVYEYGPNEYVAVRSGISPSGKFAITAHGEGELGYENFNLYLTDAITGKSIGTLDAIQDPLDSGADAFAAKWSKDSQEVTIIYRISRQEPLRAVTFRIAGRKAKRVKGPFEVHGKSLLEYWQKQTWAPRGEPKIFGTPKPKADCR